MSRPGVALVTGGSRGIGRAISLALAQDGPVAVNYRSDVEAAKSVVAAIENAAGEAICVQADVTDPEQVAGMFAEVEERLGPIGCLVNNAGTRSDGLAIKMSDASWDLVLRTNLYGAFSCTRRALRTMLRQRSGRIVNISSVAGLHGSPGQANYSAAKAGLIGFTKTVAREVAAKGITVNAVAPGPVETELLADLSPDAKERLLDGVPARRAIAPAEIASCVRWLCGDDASTTTGAVFVIDGGMTA
ncbi:MAG: 3-oxoacyl-ACP reductase family protein [Actinomycetota bacterium]